MKVKCTNCGRTLAEGNLPATVKIKCPKCKVVNDLNVQDKSKPFAERLGLEKKDGLLPIGFTCGGKQIGANGQVLEKKDEIY